jgi:cbb3-type cytochrome oxidase subunit 3
MPDPAAPHVSPGRGKDPNFMVVIAAAVVVLLVVFIAALLIVHHSGRKLLPQKQHDNEPHSYLRLPDSARTLA